VRVDSVLCDSLVDDLESKSVNTCAVVYENDTDFGQLNVIPSTLSQPSTAVLPSETRNSSGDEIANVNFLYDDIVHVLQNTIDWCINSATNRRGYVLERMFTKFSEITQFNGHYAVQGNSRSPILVPIESSYTTSY